MHNHTRKEVIKHILRIVRPMPKLLLYNLPLTTSFRATTDDGYLKYIAIRWLRFKGWSIRTDEETRQLMLDGNDFIVVYFKYFRAMSRPMPLGLRLRLYAAYMLALR